MEQIEKDELFKKLDETNKHLKSIDKQLNLFYILGIISIVATGAYLLSIFGVFNQGY